MTQVEVEVEVDAMADWLITVCKYQEDEEKEQGQRQKWNKRQHIPQSPYLSLFFFPPKGGVGKIYLYPHCRQQHRSSQIMQLQVVVELGGKGGKRVALAAAVKEGGDKFIRTNCFTTIHELPS